jgi:hypothetical protein
MNRVGAFDAYVIDEQEKREKARAWAEYCQEQKEHGLPPLGFTEWEEKMESEAA